MKRLNKVRRPEAWVISREVGGPNGVCEQTEWEAMERATPGRTFVVQSGIADKGVTELFARGVPCNPVQRVWRKRLPPTGLSMAAEPSG